MRRKQRMGAAILAAALFVTFLSSATIHAADEIDYTIQDPYAGVDWANDTTYRADLHAHSYATDGDTDFNQMIEEHYAKGYDILSMTDHGTVDYSWVKPNTVPLLFGVLAITQQQHWPTITGLTEERWRQISTGSDRLNSKGEPQKMLRVSYGVEHNPTSFNNAHVCSWFVDYGNGILGGTSDYDTPIREVNARGGLCVINHPGEYTGMKEVKDPDAAYGEGESYKIAKYANLLTTYPNLLGIDMNSKTDGRTHNDRKLWDILLQRVVPTGRNVFGMASSDAHQLNVVDSGWVMPVMPSNTEDNLKTALKNGAFFAGSHYIKNSKELAILAEETGVTLGEEWVADADEAEPTVTKITVDQQGDSITLTTENALSVHWIADGNVIATGETLELDKVSDQVTSYVRAELWSKGGVLYTQPFVLQYDGAPTATAPDFFDWGNVVRIFADILLPVLRWNPLFDAVWGWLTNTSGS
ncbi:MAG: hypothetical protein LBB67_05725 [Oscillospiraceae bacterium]|jgi:hypothetical protein|nr:hypothetical protein [Oscillospiraceae bacterium]